MDVLLSMDDVSLRAFLHRALPRLGFRALDRPAGVMPAAVIVDAGPRLLVLHGEGRVRPLDKPFLIDDLRRALRPV